MKGRKAAKTAFAAVPTAVLAVNGQLWRPIPCGGMQAVFRQGYAAGEKCYKIGIAVFMIMLDAWIAEWISLALLPVPAVLHPDMADAAARQG